MKQKTKSFPKALFGKRLRALREQIGISQLEFAEKIKRTRISYLQLEAGKASPSASLMIDIVNVLESNNVKITLDYLFGRTDTQSYTQEIQAFKSKISLLETELRHLSRNQGFAKATDQR